MESKTIGEIISVQRKELGMTQKELAEKLYVTDKAVSKWERDVAFPDTATIPKLAELLGLSVEELLGAKAAVHSVHRKQCGLTALLLKAVAAAMGVAVTVTVALGALDTQDGCVMLGIGLACVGVYLLRNGE